MGETNEARIRYLEILQGIINRMADNSFKMKEWFITVLCACIAAYVGTGKALMFLVIVFAAIVFGLLDVCYLREERTFRKIYNNASNLKVEITDFKINPKELNKEEKCGFFPPFSSWSIYILYGLAIIAGVTCFILCKCNVIK